MKNEERGRYCDQHLSVVEGPGLTSTIVSLEALATRPAKARVVYLSIIFSQYT